MLLPPDLQEWVPPGHLAHHVSDVVDALDLTSFYAPYEGDGRRNAPYEPSMMVKVLIYAYAPGTFSSRAVARKLEEDVAFRMLAAGNFPQHRTVCEFRCRHLGEFSELFVQVVRVAREMGLARFGKLSVDGTKVRANASKRKAMSYERMGQEEVRLQAQIEALLRKAGAVDAEEDEHWGRRFPGRRTATGVATQGEAPGGDPGSQSAFGRRRNAGATMSAGASLGRTAIPGAGGPTSGATASPSRRRRAISPIPRARS